MAKTKTRGSRARRNPSTRQPNLQDFEKSPLRFHYDAVLEEYKVLWAEINGRLANMQQITNFALILIGAILALSQVYSKTDTFSAFFKELLPFFPGLALLFSGLALMQVDHASMIAYIGDYIDKELRPTIKHVITLTNNYEPKLWQWNQFKSSKRYSIAGRLIHSLSSSANFFVTGGMSILLLAIYFYSSGPATITTDFEIVLLWLSLIAATGMLISNLLVGISYYNMRSKSK